jgi:hypothetical protein
MHNQILADGSPQILISRRMTEVSEPRNDADNKKSIRQKLRLVKKDEDLAPCLPAIVKR